MQAKKTKKLKKLQVYYKIKNASSVAKGYGGQGNYELRQVSLFRSDEVRA